MRKYLKYDLKSNKKFFASTFLVFVIFFLSILSVRLVGSLNSLIEVESAMFSLKIILIIVLSMTLIWFIFNSFYKDFYSKRGLLTFSLPIKFRSFIFSKVFVINLFYFILAGFLLLVYYLLLDTDIYSLLEILLFLFLIENYISQLILLAIQIDRFKNKRILSLFVLLLFPISIIGGLMLLSKEEIGTILNLYSYLYFLLLSLIFFIFNSIYMKYKFDLS